MAASLDSEPIAILMKSEYADLIGIFDLIISIHCKQLFPAELVQKVRCINVHPGYNPFNRGWFPNVYGILNGLPFGVTIHEMDSLLDNGPIIWQERVPIYLWDTAFDVYERVQFKEKEMLTSHFADMCIGSYTKYLPSEPGNLNWHRDFKALCEIDKSKVQSVGETIDYLRALTHGEFKNAFFVDPETGKKIFIRLLLEKED
jgi:methionyl-tRNA formyltransferase